MDYTGQRQNQLRIISYNSTGFNDDKQNYLKTIALESQCDFILTQEHRQTSDNLHKIKSAMPGFIGIACSGIDKMQNILMGRPYGGCSILWCSGLTHMVKTIQVESLSRRLCSVIVTLNNYKLILICVYFPTDPGSADYNGAGLDIRSDFRIKYQILKI